MLCSPDLHGKKIIMNILDNTGNTKITGITSSRHFFSSYYLISVVEMRSFTIKQDLFLALKKPES
jgi:hypothetical protein